MRSGTGGFPCLTSPSLYALGFISAVFCTSLEHRTRGSLCCSKTKHTVLCMVSVQSSPSTSTALMVCYTTQGCSAQQEQVIVARPPESQEVWGIGWFYPPPPLSEFHFWFALISFIVPIRISTTQAAERAFVSWSWFWVWRAGAGAVQCCRCQPQVLPCSTSSPGCSSAARQGEEHQEP